MEAPRDREGPHFLGGSGGGGLVVIVVGNGTVSDDDGLRVVCRTPDVGEGLVGAEGDLLVGLEQRTVEEGASDRGGWVAVRSESEETDAVGGEFGVLVGGRHERQGFPVLST